MAGVSLEAANLGWHGIEGDRRHAFRVTAARGGMPWLTASRLNDLGGPPGAEALGEAAWVGRALVFGDDTDGPAVAVPLRDLRCVMVNLDPDTAEKDPRVMKTTARLNGNYAGVYGSVVREGR